MQNSDMANYNNTTVKKSEVDMNLYAKLDEGISKMCEQNSLHIPYILNGEFYKIKSQDGENVTVKCCHCPPDRVYRGSVRSTGNFHMHIKRRHPDLLGKLHNMKVNALLERRDKMMKNRNVRSRIALTPMNTSTKCLTIKSEDPASTAYACNHSLKIKTVFQRHQRQAEEAIKNFNSPTASQNQSVYGKESDGEVYPLDLTCRSNKTMEPMHHEDTLGIAYLNSSKAVEPNAVSDMFRKSIPTPLLDEVPSVESMSSNTTGECQNFSTLTSSIKNEQTMLGNVLDLSTTEKGDMNSLGVFAGRAQLSLDTHLNNEFVNWKWLEIVQHAKGSALDLVNELRAHNQIELNRLMLDIAKFKYLHPNFHFQFPSFK